MSLFTRSDSETIHVSEGEEKAGESLAGRDGLGCVQEGMGRLRGGAAGVQCGLRTRKRACASKETLS